MSVLESKASDKRTLLSSSVSWPRMPPMACTHTVPRLRIVPRKQCTSPQTPTSRPRVPIDPWPISPPLELHPHCTCRTASAWVSRSCPPSACPCTSASCYSRKNQHEAAGREEEEQTADVPGAVGGLLQQLALALVPGPLGHAVVHFHHAAVTNTSQFMLDMNLGGRVERTAGCRRCARWAGSRWGPCGLGTGTRKGTRARCCTPRRRVASGTHCRRPARAALPSRGS